MAQPISTLRCHAMPWRLVDTRGLGQLQGFLEEVFVTVTHGRLLVEAREPVGTDGWLVEG